MPRVAKYIKYKEEQNEIIMKLLKLVCDEDNTFISYEIINDVEKQEKIMKMVPEIKKYFNYSKIKGIVRPDITKKSYLSILKQILRTKFELANSYIMYNTPNGRRIQTGRYFLKLKK